MVPRRGDSREARYWTATFVAAVTLTATTPSIPHRDDATATPVLIPVTQAPAHRTALVSRRGSTAVIGGGADCWRLGSVGDDLDGVAGSDHLG
jgi:hypothetical protein